MKTTRMSAFGLAVALGFAAAVAAQEPCPCPPAAKPPEPVWKSKLSLGYLATTGNSDTSTLGASLLVSREPEPWGLEIFGSYDKAEDEGVVKTERALARLRVRRTLGERWELFGEASGEQDENAGFELRFLLSAGVTYHALKGPKHLLDLDAGLTWTDEDRVEPAADASFAGGLTGLRYEYKLSEHATVSERLAAYLSFEESSDWRLESQTALEAALTDRLALKIGYEVRYVNEPVGGREDTDTTARVALVLNF